MKKYVVFLVVSLLVSCNKSEELNSNIPNSPVSFSIDVSIGGADSELRYENVGYSKLFNTTHPAAMSAGHGRYGYSGVVVTRAMDNKLYAFEACCPYECKKEISLNVDGYFLKCGKCGSSFEVGNGSGRVNKGPASQPLKIYNVYESPSGVCNVVN
ncbi:MAG: hypothetical protein MJ010_03015 [Paludibacteraceae bacterium]|nr:hypothetical protein [Paludibacteraceae bacterium]